MMLRMSGILPHYGVAAISAAHNRYAGRKVSTGLSPTGWSISYAKQTKWKTNRDSRHRRCGTGGNDRATQGAGRRGREDGTGVARQGQVCKLGSIWRKATSSRWTSSSTAADPKNYDALVLPGGVANPDQLRTIPQAVEFVKSFFERDKPVAAICHAPWMLVEAGVVRGRTVTSWPSLQTDLKNAGAKWVDREVVEDGDLVTSRKPDDLPAFNKKIVELFSEAPQRAREHEPVGPARINHRS